MTVYRHRCEAAVETTDSYLYVAVTVKLEFGNVNINVNFFRRWENYFPPYFPYHMQHCTWIWPNSDRCLLNCFLVVACSEAFAEEKREYNVDWLSHHETLRNCVCIRASVNSTRATAAHLSTLSVPGVGHLQILHCQGAGHLPTPGAQVELTDALQLISIITIKIMSFWLNPNPLEFWAKNIREITKCSLCW